MEPLCLQPKTPYVVVSVRGNYKSGPLLKFNVEIVPLFLTLQD
jgi:hypothetical protein